MSAVISACGKYRYLLTRQVSSFGTTCAFVMLNPSTADGTNDDPTIRRCIGFVRKWGFSRLEVVNLFAWRATSPKELRVSHDPIGLKNDQWINAVAKRATVMVCAWGRHGTYLERGERVRKLLAWRSLYSLGINRDGTPKHPLYVRGDQPLVPFA